MGYHRTIQIFSTSTLLTTFLYIHKGENMKILCKLLGHNWDMYRGFEEIKPHGRAICQRCGVKYKDIKR